MQQKYVSRPRAHLIRITMILVGALVAGLVVREFFLPESFGIYGHYRPAAVEEEMARPIRHMTNESCLACHPFIKKIHLDGVHKTVSCEFCHGPYADHVTDNKKTGTLPVKRGEEIKELCLRCHNKIIRARPKESIKMVAMPEHLEKKKVRTDHTCNQCHHVHSPLKWVLEAREAMGLVKKEEKAPWMN